MQRLRGTAIMCSGSNMLRLLRHCGATEWLCKQTLVLGNALWNQMPHSIIVLMSDMSALPPPLNFGS